jgi:hypothetical protein
MILIVNDEATELDLTRVGAAKIRVKDGSTVPFEQVVGHADQW